MQPRRVAERITEIATGLFRPLAVLAPWTDLIVCWRTEHLKKQEVPWANLHQDGAG